MKRLTAGLAITSALCFGALAERVADPLERHEIDYSLEGPNHQSEVFYMSVNSHYNGEKHDDRVGDAMLAAGALAAMGALALPQQAYRLSEKTFRVEN
jgi:hypothetical protein